MSLIKKNSTATVATVPNSEDYEELVEALQGIAIEILKYQDPCCQASFHAKYGPVPKFKSDTNITEANNLPSKFCDRLKAACNAAAKVVTLTNDYQVPEIENQISIVKSHSNGTLHDRDKCVDLINKLTRESIVSSVKREVLHAFILLGYRELQKLRQEPEEDIGIAMKLKHIIVACGQYYADSCNERQRRIRVEHKNEHLQNKLKVLRTHLGAVNYLKDEVKHLKKRNEELKKDLKKYSVTNGNHTACEKKSSSATFFTYTHSGGNFRRSAGSKRINRRETFSLSSHLTVISNLIDEQENMMSGLLEITKTLTQPNVS